jgi:tail fiber protein gp32
MALMTITSANSLYLISVVGVYDTPQQLQGFGVDEAFDTEVAEMAEVQLGIDGFSASGWLPRLTTQTVTLLAASPSFRVFEDWAAAMDLAREVIYATAVVTIPAVGRKYSFRQGTLTRYPAMPNARRTLQQRQFTITWAHGITGADSV